MASVLTFLWVNGPTTDSEGIVGHSLHWFWVTVVYLPYACLVNCCKNVCVKTVLTRRFYKNEKRTVEKTMCQNKINAVPIGIERWISTELNTYLIVWSSNSTKFIFFYFRIGIFSLQFENLKSLNNSKIIYSLIFVACDVIQVVILLKRI